MVPVCQVIGLSFLSTDDVIRRLGDIILPAIDPTGLFSPPVRYVAINLLH